MISRTAVKEDLCEGSHLSTDFTEGSGKLCKYPWGQHFQLREKESKGRSGWAEWKPQQASGPRGAKADSGGLSKPWSGLWILF